MVLLLLYKAKQLCKREKLDSYKELNKEFTREE